MKSAVHTRIFLALVAVLLVAAGCRKLKHSESGSTTTVTPGTQNPGTMTGTAGKGGSASFRLTANHDGINVDSCMFYVKYNANVIPLDGNYDDSAWCVQVNGTPVASFYGLKTGNYYLYGKGWDLIRSQHVMGGIPFTVIETNKATEHTLVIPVQDYQ